MVAKTARQMLAGCSRDVVPKLDGRTRQSRRLGQMRREMSRHLDRQPSPVEAEIIDRIVWQKLHLARLDAKAAGGAQLSGDEIRLYTSLTSGIMRAMRALGLKAAAAPQLTARQLMGLDPMPAGIVA
jgi:hypothetical protein